MDTAVTADGRDEARRARAAALADIAQVWAEAPAEVPQAPAEAPAVKRAPGAAPCEARKYLGQGAAQGGGGPEYLCPHPIAYRVVFRTPSDERAAIAYFCEGHAAEVLGIVNRIAHALMPDASPDETEGTGAAHLLGGIDVKRYRPRSATRKAQVHA